MKMKLNKQNEEPVVARRCVVYVPGSEEKATVWEVTGRGREGKGRRQTEVEEVSEEGLERGKMT